MLSATIWLAKIARISGRRPGAIQYEPKEEIGLLAQCSIPNAENSGLRSAAVQHSGSIKLKIDLRAIPFDETAVSDL
jgi:hypothetical protein